jgi:tRNA modification GTPase
VYQQLLDSHANKIILIRNKSDLPVIDIPITHQAIEVSTKSGSNILQIHDAIEEKIQELFAKSDAPFLLNARQFNAIQSIEQKVQSIRAMLEKTPEYELLSYHLNDALAQVTELTGKSISEAAMDAIFREFCVGK